MCVGGPWTHKQDSNILYIRINWLPKRLVNGIFQPKPFSCEYIPFLRKWSPGEYLANEIVQFWKREFFHTFFFFFVSKKKSMKLKWTFKRNQNQMGHKFQGVEKVGHSFWERWVSTEATMKSKWRKHERRKKRDTFGKGIKEKKKQPQHVFMTSSYITCTAMGFYTAWEIFLAQLHRLMAWANEI
jgi:hypothetical protein